MQILGSRWWSIPKQVDGEDIYWKGTFILRIEYSIAGIGFLGWLEVSDVNAVTIGKCAGQSVCSAL